MEDMYAYEDEEYDELFVDDPNAPGGRMSMLVPRRLDFPGLGESAFDTKQRLQVFVRLRPTDKPTCVTAEDDGLLKAVVKGKATLYRCAPPRNMFAAHAWVCKILSQLPIGSCTVV